mmetsp:Transcript_38052/g.68546  ORF Transcript_38052/g.68546 Transcript_38052/m.68546 type:complete len:240 (-) Transcript_38052:929-1648(-)
MKARSHARTTTRSCPASNSQIAEQIMMRSRSSSSIPPRPKCQLFLPTLSITASNNNTCNSTTSQLGQIQAQLQRNLIRTKPINLHILLHAKSIIQQEAMIALLPIRIIHLRPPPNTLQSSNRKTLRLLAKRPLGLPRPIMIQHIRMRNQRRRPMAIDEQPEIPRTHDHARPLEFLEGGNGGEFGGDADDGFVVLAYGIGAIGDLDEEVASPQSGEFLLRPEQGHVPQTFGQDVVVWCEE